MRILAITFGIALILIILWDAFETIVLPRTVTRRIRLTRLFYRGIWVPWSVVACLLPPGKRRETLMSFFGPLSLILLLAVWAIGLVVGFGLLHWGVGSPMQGGGTSPSLGTDVYLSGSTFFTLGIGDITPRGPLARILTVAEAGIGFGFLAAMIGYLPVIYQSFSRREVTISLLDARAGSPPTATELLRRHSREHGLEALQQVLQQWELWSADFMESHLSYPVLAYYRSQHSNQSWLAALTAILDTCALVMVGVEGTCARQARLTFAIARHAVVDLAQIFRARPQNPKNDRLPPETLAKLRAELGAAGLPLRGGPETDRELSRLRKMYEPYVFALSRRLLLDLPPWRTESHRNDNWQTSAWEGGAGAPRIDSSLATEKEHF